MSSVNDNRGRIGCQIYDATNLTPAEKRIEKFLDIAAAQPKTRLKSGADALKEIHALERGRAPAAPARPTYKNPPNMRANQTEFGNNYDANYEAFLDVASRTNKR